MDDIDGAGVMDDIDGSVPPGTMPCMPFVCQTDRLTWGRKHTDGLRLQQLREKREQINIKFSGVETQRT